MLMIFNYIYWLKKELLNICILKFYLVIAKNLNKNYLRVSFYSKIFKLRTIIILFKLSVFKYLVIKKLKFRL